MIGDLGTSGAPANDAAAATSTAPSDVGFVQADTTASSDVAFGQDDGSASTFAGIDDVTADAGATGAASVDGLGGDDFGALAGATDVTAADDDPSSG